MKFTTGQGWQEAVTSVRDLDRWVESLDFLAGWQGNRASKAID